MKRAIRRAVPLVLLILLAPTARALAAPDDPARVQVLRSSGYLRADGRVGISVRANCDPGLQAFELDVTLRQGDVLGFVSILERDVVPCDDAWHNVRVKISPQDGRFRHGLIDVDVYFGVFDPNQGDLDDTAATTVRI